MTERPESVRFRVLPHDANWGELLQEPLVFRIAPTRSWNLEPSDSLSSAFAQVCCANELTESAICDGPVNRENLVS